MIHAYNELYVEKAKETLGTLFEHGTISLGISLDRLYSYFLVSDVSKRFERGFANTIVGKSSIELAFEVLDSVNVKYKRKEQILFSGKTEEFWTGWALAYYQ